MEKARTKVFISFYYDEASEQKDKIKELLGEDIISKSVEEGDISDDKTDEQIRKIIRDEYLKDSTVTIVLIGDETKGRKHVDWEIYASMYDQKDGHTKSGILAIDLNDRYWLNSSEIREKNNLSSGVNATKESKSKGVAHFPERLRKNIIKDNVTIRVAKYSEVISDKEYLLDLIEEAKGNREKNEYDISDPLRRKNG